MSELGAKECSKSDCPQHDFLPFTCGACNHIFCVKHYEIAQHDCPKSEEFLATRGAENYVAQPSRTRSHPSTSSKPSEVIMAVTSRFVGRDDELNAGVTHYNIKTSEDVNTNGGAGSPDERLKSAEMAVKRATTAKAKRVSSQVHRMLLKSKSVGDKKLRMEDRFFLEVHYYGNNNDVHHLFFSRLWTVGRTLDDILKTRKKYLILDAGDEDRPLELAVAGSSLGLPIGSTLLDLAPALESFDAVTIRPRAAQVGVPAEPQADARALREVKGEGADVVAMPTSTIGGGGGDFNPEADTNRHETDSFASLISDCGSRDAESAASIGPTDSEEFQAATEAVNSESDKDTKTNGEDGAISLTIGHGKAVYQLGGLLPDRCRVLDIKRRLEALTGVPVTRQKLLFKGVLRDDDLLSFTKLADGVKVMLLGASSKRS